MSRPFLKMNGLGNDFVVIEGRSQPFAPTPAQVRALARRDQGGVGCDQLIAIEPSTTPRDQGGADAFMRIWNADGDEVSACGNATRCVAWLLMEASGRDEAVVETRAGRLAATRAGPKVIAVDMGPPRLDWRDIPLAEEMDTKGIELAVGPPTAPRLHTPGCVSMGNPHVVFFVPDAEAAPVKSVGPLIEHHPLFPEGVNVGFCEVRDRTHLRLKVWERGAGQTLACGTGACAALAAAARRGLCDRSAEVELDGGVLHIEWRESDGHVIMTGPVELEFTGRLPEAETVSG
jgi:diaminopimelate epimerase